MSLPTGQLLSTAQGYRQQARRARRLAAGMSCDVTMGRLQHYADRLDGAATRMEREAAARRAQSLDAGKLPPEP